MNYRNCRYSRRNFIKLSAQIGGYLALSSCAGIDRRIWGSQTKLDKEVLILGGGLSGLSSALHLKQKQIPFVIYEAQDRVGGRVFSMANPLDPKEFVDMGGQFVESHHTTMRALAKDFFVKLEKYQDWTLPAVEMKELEKMAERDFLLLDAISFAEFLSEAKHVSSINIKSIHQLVLKKWGVPSESLSALPVCLQFNLFKGTLETYQFPDSTHEFMNSFYHRTAGTDFGQGVQHGNELVELKEDGGRFELTFLKNGRESHISCTKLICALPLSTLSKVKGIEKLKISAEKKYWIQNAAYSHHRRLFIPGDDAMVNKKRTIQDTYFIEKRISGLQIDSSRLDLGQLQEKLIEDKLISKASESQGILKVDWGLMRFQRGKGLIYPPKTFIDFMYAITQPEYGKNFFLVGEHASLEFAGTMNGAVESGILAAQNISS